MEEQLNLIARGEADFLKVLGEVIKLFKKKYQFFTKNIEDMDSLFEVSFTPLADSGKALSRWGLILSESSGTGVGNKKRNKKEIYLFI